MVRRTPTDKGRRRVVAGGTRRTVAGKAKATGLTLDDTPLGISLMRDAKRLLVRLPYELWTVELRGEELHFSQNIELKAERPSVSEGDKGTLWIGGDHLHRGSAFASQISKVGSKLGGYVDHLAVLRPGLLASVGSQGELLFDLDKEKVLHQRKSKGARGLSVAASADERAIFANGSSAAWVIDPAHPGGYTQLRFERRSPHDPSHEAVTRVHVDHKGRCILAAADGAVAWTHSSLRRAGEAWVELAAADRRCLALACDDNWLYVLRPRARLQRFLLEALPDADAEPASPRRGRGRGHSHERAKAAAKTDPLSSQAQECRLSRPATCLVALPAETPAEASADNSSPGTRLVIGGPQSEGQLGRLWIERAESLEWNELRCAPRPISEAAPELERAAPNFEQIRNKLPADAAKLAALSVDEVMGGRIPFWVVQGGGQWVERSVARVDADALLPGDTLLLPAMIRTKEGTARPALLAWPGLPLDRDAPTPEPTWLCWGDRPRGWMPLDTPHIREQRWSRASLFPMQVSLRAVPEAPGRRATLPKRWPDREQFNALVQECKKLLKVLW